jgi:hypothetical protein
MKETIMKQLRIRHNHSAFHKLSEKLALQAAFHKSSQHYFEAAQRDEQVNGYTQKTEALYTEANRLHQCAENLFINKNVFRDGNKIVIEMQKPDEQWASWFAEAESLARAAKLRNELATKQSMYSVQARATVKES